ncbi:MAG: TetR family transcriptional regulator [Bryobacteraceae bacterium]
MKTTSKSDATRARIFHAAMDLFRRQGFDATTMREIAAAADVAGGAAYYYFDSKDAIVLAFYDQARQEMEPLLEQALATGKDLRRRLLALLNVKFAYFAPNRSLLGTLSAYTNPEHPLSPFSDATREIREKDIAFFERALEGTRVRIPDDLRPHLPRLLWMYQMGLILFWIYDRSPEQRRTQVLVEKSLVLVARLIRLSSFPLLIPLRRTVVELLKAVAE